MFTKVIKFIPLVCLCILTQANAAVIPPCPAEITTSQTLSHTFEGWRLFKNVNPHYLSQIEIYDGKPEDLACLKPDSQNSEKATWHFQPSRTIYMVCRYNDTNIQLTRPLPRSVTHCTLFYKKYVQNSAGSGVPDYVLCR